MITSAKNDKIKAIRKLHKKKERTESETFIVEGHHLVEEARKSNWTILEIIAQEGIQLPEWCGSLPVTIVTEQVFQQVSQTKSPQGIAAVLKINEAEVNLDAHLLLIDAIQDPGNLGTIIRTADAAGFGGIILGEGTVDLFNDKVVRSTQGSLFHIPIKVASLDTEVEQLKQNDYKIWATALQNAHNFSESNRDKKVALILGNEGAGVQRSLQEAADKVVKIPIHGEAESLNVSIAAGILMYYIKG
ncbi:TrmH family RNA methyltransferase [Oceanobacillus manasiensis]|uniref:TrmH family RNA methyltransferase n=1 Tax=Oceanobacillus manasiensis TaxID=586413 RepID=UPI0005A857A2|nr:RNA methyltransferase [Oceanobacillus manasiensis]